MSLLDELLSSTSMLIFDCDGVVLNSNQIKTDAFRIVASSYGARAAENLVDYHLTHGGISRYRKFEFFLREIMGLTYEPSEVQALANAYSFQVIDALMQAEVTPGLHELRIHTSQCSWMMVSGGDQSELRRVLKSKGLAALFDRGIHGSPASKDEIFRQERQSGNIDSNAIYLGDSQYDHLAAKHANLRFIFVSEWTDFKAWPSYCSEHGIQVITRVCDLQK